MRIVMMPQNLKLISAFFAFALAAITSGCGVIPHTYRGQYFDETHGVRLELKTSEGLLQTGSGREITAKAENLGFDKLSAGTAGIYVIDNPTSKNLLEIHWINPKLESKKEEGGLIWFESEVLYSFFDTTVTEKANSIELIHCENGTVLLDPPSKRWQIGCPAGTVSYYLKRADRTLGDRETGSISSRRRHR